MRYSDWRGLGGGGRGDIWWRKLRENGKESQAPGFGKVHA
jgi:hypothetical protein